MSERRSDRAVSILLSFLIHAAIVGALLWGWWRYRQPTPAPQTLAIEATVVRSAPLTPAPTPAPEQPTPAPTTPPTPTPPTPDPQAEERARAERAAKEQAEQQAAEAQRQAKLEADKKAQAQAEAEAEAKAQQEAEQKAKAEAEQKAKAEAEKKAQELAQQQAQQKKLEQERAQREADMRSQLAAEEHLNAVQSSPAKAEYLSLITARINRAWIRPPSARSGVKCTVHITQIPGGEITHVSVQGCNGDEAVRQSVETAAYRASPLPAPADPALFDPNIDVTFAPDE